MKDTKRSAKSTTATATSSSALSQEELADLTVGGPTAERHLSILMLGVEAL